MAWTVRTSTATSGPAGTSPTLVINSAVVAGDILVLAITNRDGTGAPTVTDNDTGGNTWAQITGSPQAANTNGSISVWWKRATSGTADVRVLAGSAIQGAGVLAAGFFATPSAGISNRFQPAFATGTNSELIYHFVGTGTAFIRASYWKGI